MALMITKEAIEEFARKNNITEDQAVLRMLQVESKIPKRASKCVACNKTLIGGPFVTNNPNENWDGEGCHECGGHLCTKCAFDKSLDCPTCGEMLCGKCKCGECC